MSGKGKEKSETSGAETQSFETILSRLEEIVGKLSQGDLSLEESIKLFEEGMELSKKGHKILDEAESKIEILLESGETKPYSPPSTEETE